MSNLGKIFKEKRKALHLSQKNTCENICFQPMLSSIEHGKYIPNSEIMILLCQRLHINMDQLSLDSNYQMSSIKDFNKQIDSLCNNHDYAKLKDFLLSEKTIENISTDRQTQAYYYYLGVAYLQTDNNLDQAEYNFKLAFSSHDNSNVLNTLDRLILISMAAIYAKKNNEKKTLDYITQAFDKFTSTKFETNQIALFYLTAYANLILEKNLDAINWVNQGIDFAAKNDSHYMLANLYYLLAQLLNKTDKSNLALDPHNRAKIFTDLFNEKIFKLD